MVLGRVLRNGKQKGVGFALASGLDELSRVVLTANHVVRDHEASSLQFVLGDGRMAMVDRVEGDDTLDIAVLHLGEPVPGALAVMVGDATKGTAWEVEALPRLNDPYLDGIVSTPRRPYRNAKGHDTYVMQLEVFQWVGGYKGYSGSPVVEKLTGGVIGVLIEQQFLRIPKLPTSLGDSIPGTNVLYAIPIQDVVDRFKLSPRQVEPDRWTARAMRVAAVADLGSLDPDKRRRALDTLGQMDDDEAREELARAITHPLGEVRVGAGLALARHGDLRAVPSLIVALDDPDVRKFTLAADALARLAGGDNPNETWRGSPEVVQIAQKQLVTAVERLALRLVDLVLANDQDYDARNAALFLLARSGQPAVPYLLEALRRGDHEVNSAIANVLGYIEGCVPELIRAVTDSNRTVRTYAVEALRHHRGCHIGNEIITALLELDYDVRRAVLSLLRGRPVYDLLDILDNKARLATQNAPKARSRSSRDHTTKEDLGKSLRREADPEKRVVIIKALERQGVQAVPVLLEALADSRDKYWRARVAAAWVLWGIADPTAMPGLETVMSELRGRRDRAATDLRYPVREALERICKRY